MGYPLSVLNGIGESRAADLARLGYETTDDLLGAEPSAVAAWIDQVEGLTYAQAITSFIPQAALLRLPSCEPSNASGLVENGVLSYRHVTFADPGLLGRSAGLDEKDPRIAAWQLDAARRAGTAIVRISVRDAMGKPVQGATVNAIDPMKSGFNSTWTWTTDARGLCLAEFIAAGRHRFLATTEQLAGIAGVTVPAEARLTLSMTARPGRAVVADEYVDGVSLFFDPTVPFRLVTVKSPTDLPGADVFQVTSLGDGSARLASARYRDVGLWREISSTTLDASLLPEGTGVGHLVTLASGVFTAGPPLSLHAWRNSQLHARLEA